MTEHRGAKVLIIGAGLAAGGNMALVLSQAGIAAGLAEDDQGAHMAEFAAGLGDGVNGTIIYLFDHPAGPETAAHAHIRTQALSLAPQIRVNGICPGPLVAGKAADIEQWSSLPLGLKVSTEGIVGAVRFILDTASITGQVIALDGGTTE